MYSMALVSWELLSYVCCKNNEQQSRHDVSIWARGLRGVGRYWVGDWGGGGVCTQIRVIELFRWELMLGPYLP